MAQLCINSVHIPWKDYVVYSGIQFSREIFQKRAQMNHWPHNRNLCVVIKRLFCSFTFSLSIYIRPISDIETTTNGFISAEDLISSLNWNQQVLVDFSSCFNR